MSEWESISALVAGIPALRRDERHPVVEHLDDTERRSDRHLLGEAAYVIRDAMHRLNVSGERVPLRWPRLLDALNRALSAGGRAGGMDLSRLKTTEQLAAEWGCTARTVRRKAEAAGGRKVNGWIFLEGT